tara:strand:- start:64 stop:678 length:615 start_codon:yes stop_codon:yes gene_type:complete
MTVKFEIEMPGKDNDMQPIFLKHSGAKEKWYLGGIDEGIEIAVEDVMIDLESLATGWGYWENKAPYYHYSWDEKLTVDSGRPDGDEWKRAFSCYIKVRGHDDPLVWRSHSWGELQGFQGMMQTLPFKSIHPIVLDGAADGKLPIVKYLRSEKPKDIQSSIPIFEFVGFGDRPENFTTPSWYLSQINPGQIDEAPQEKPEDDIPF